VTPPSIKKSLPRNKGALRDHEQRGHSGHFIGGAAASGRAQIEHAPVPVSLVAEHLTAGRLIQMLAEWSPRYSGLCLYYPANRHPPMALRVFVQAVREWAADSASLSIG
jgi:DNA-binding transcriptional LysR family regulator